MGENRVCQYPNCQNILGKTQTMFCSPEHRSYCQSAQDFTYTPDFFVGNKIVEIKGYENESFKEKFSLFEKLYPNQKVTILRKDDLILMGVL